MCDPRRHLIGLYEAFGGNPFDFTDSFGQDKGKAAPYIRLNSSVITLLDEITLQKGDIIFVTHASEAWDKKRSAFKEINNILDIAYNRKISSQVIHLRLHPKHNIHYDKIRQGELTIDDSPGAFIVMPRTIKGQKDMTKRVINPDIQKIVKDVVEGGQHPRYIVTGGYFSACLGSTGVDIMGMHKEMEISSSIEIILPAKAIYVGTRTPKNPSPPVNLYNQIATSDSPLAFFEHQLSDFKENLVNRHHFSGTLNIVYSSAGKKGVTIENLGKGQGTLTLTLRVIQGVK